MGRTAAAQAPDEYAAPDLRVEGQVAYRAATEPAANGPGWFETVVYIRATSTEGAKLEYGGCPFTIQVFDTPTQNGRPRWDDRDVPNAICTTELTIARLRQGQVDTLRALLPPADVLGDSLASGRYYVGALVRTNHDTLVIEAGTLDLHP
jgi:hypothetical protein